MVFEAERTSLVPYAGPFDGFRATTLSPSKTCLINFDRNRYSIDSRAAGRPVEVRAYATRIEVWQGGRVIADHARVFGRDQHVYDPRHYLPILERKPGALRNGAPFKDWILPPSITAVVKKLAGQPDGDKQIVEILSAILNDGLEAVEAACGQALTQNTCKACVVINILSRKREPPLPVNIITPDALKLAVEPLADCQRYDNLRTPIHGTNRHSSSLCQTETIRHESRL